MKPRLPKELLQRLRDGGQKPPWKCKLKLRRGRMVYAVEINGEGEITNVEGRTIYSASDVGFSPEVIEDIET